jgi:hypothetical protein
MLLMMLAVSFISTIKVDSPPLRLSDAPYPGEDLIGQRDPGGVAGDEAAHMRHQCDEGCLPQAGRFYRSC